MLLTFCYILSRAKPLLMMLTICPSHQMQQHTTGKNIFSLTEFSISPNYFQISRLFHVFQLCLSPTYKPLLPLLPSCIGLGNWKNSITSPTLCDSKHCRWHKQTCVLTQVDVFLRSTEHSCVHAWHHVVPRHHVVQHVHAVL